VNLIQGQVLDPQGRPVAGAAVYVASAPAAMPDIAQLTDADGRFTVAAPVAGRYTLGARSDEFGQARAEVEVGGGGAVVVEIRFGRPEETQG